MIREVIATGRDADSAIENGCRELGVPREEAEFEIISLPKKSFFGLKTYPAKVRVYVELPDVVRSPRPPKEGQALKAAQPAQQPKAAAPAPKKEQREKAPRPPKEGQAPKAAQPAQQPKAVAPAPKKEQREKAPRPPKEGQAPKGERPPKALAVEVQPDQKLEARVAKTCAYLEGVLQALGVTQMAITSKYYAENVYLQLTGNGLGVIIGRRGETLDALQYLASLVANRGEGEYVRINIDSGNYREKRKRTLENLAHKLANQAVKTGKSTTLEPMNPYERRIIHGAVSQVKGATSSSVGVDPNRRVVISALEGAKRPSRGRGRGRGRKPAPQGERPAQEKTILPPDLADFTETVREDLQAPPPPTFGTREPAAPVAAPAPKEEAAPQQSPQAKPRRTLEEELLAAEKAPRYGKIEL